MAKDTYYFTHDYNARNDIKVKKLISKHGYLGYGIFWAIIEELYNNANALPIDFDCIAFDLRCDSDLVNSIVTDFELFVFEGKFFGSLSVQKRLNERDEKSKKAKDSASKRWGNKGSNANALRPHSEGNAIKERKRKEKKEPSARLNYDFIEEQFKPAFREWVKYKKDIEKPFSIQSVLEASYKELRELSKGSAIEAVKIVQYSIANNYQSLNKKEGKHNPVSTSKLQYGYE